MSVKSCPESGDTSMAVIEDDVYSEITPRGVRRRTVRTFTGVKEELLNSLIKSRSGYVASMTRFQREIQTSIENNGELSDVEVKLTTYNSVWIKYVNVHERILQLLDSEEKKLKSCSRYEDQRNKKVNLELLVSSWRRVTNDRLERSVITSVNKTQSSRRSGKSSKSNSKLSTLSQRKESLALAELKISQINRRRELLRRKSELQFEEEIMNAEMELEEARTRLKVCEDDRDIAGADKSSQDLDGMDEYFDNTIKLLLSKDDNDDHDIVPCGNENVNNVQREGAHLRSNIIDNATLTLPNVTMTSTPICSSSGDNSVQTSSLIQVKTTETPYPSMSSTAVLSTSNTLQRFSSMYTLPTFTSPTVKDVCVTRTIPTISSVLNDQPKVVNPSVSVYSPVVTTSDNSEGSKLPNCLVSAASSNVSLSRTKLNSESLSVLQEPPKFVNSTNTSAPVATECCTSESVTQTNVFCFVKCINM